MILSLLYTFIVILGPVDASSSSRFLSTCEAIAHTISSQSNVYYPGMDASISSCSVTITQSSPGSENYVDDNHHWAPSSSSQSTCSVGMSPSHDSIGIWLIFPSLLLQSLGLLTMSLRLCVSSKHMRCCFVLTYYPSAQSPG